MAKSYDICHSFSNELFNLLSKVSSTEIFLSYFPLKLLRLSNVTICYQTILKWDNLKTFTFNNLSLLSNKT